MQLLTRFPYWRSVFRMSCTILLLISALWMEASGSMLIHAATGSANFSLQPASFDPANPLTQSYFIFNARPGTFVSGRVRVANTGTARGTVEVYPVDATTSPTGGLAYVTNTTRLRNVGSWVALSKLKLTLDPGQTKTIRFGLLVPYNVSPGQHVGGLVAENMASQSAPSTNQGSIEINLSLKKLYGLPIVVNIPGRVQELLATSGATFDTTSPYQRILIGLTNAGNDILYPQGMATIIDSRGTFVQTTQLNISAILPHTFIEYPLNITKTALPVGPYKIRFILNYGKQRKNTLNTTLTFRVRSSGKSLATLASQVVVQGPIDFLRSLALWQYALAVVVLLLVGSALFFWIHRAYTMALNVRHKSGGRRISHG